MSRLSNSPPELRERLAGDNLRTHDLYDIWKTPLGIRVKKLFNRNRYIGLGPSAILTIIDLYLNDHFHVGYMRQEYPIARAWAALILLNEHQNKKDQSLLGLAARHLEWLVDNSCTGYSGPCWGLAFDYAVSADFHYDENTPLTTMTPYALEAFVRYQNITGDARFNHVIRGINDFLQQDVPILEETDEYAVTAYSTIADRRVINAVSYVLYSYALMLPFLDNRSRLRCEAMIPKLYTFITRNQQNNGSWYYSPDGNSFIDCFHSCIVLKNLKKASALTVLKDVDSVIDRGYRYLKDNLFVPKRGLFKRFSVTNKPGLIDFDLYDNAEMLNLSMLLGDHELAESLHNEILRHFVRGRTVYSQIDVLGIRHRPNTLRWAVLPWMYSLSLTEWSQLTPRELSPSCAA
jgi:hypothetical protein